MSTDECTAPWIRYRRTLTRAAMFAAVGVLSWWFGVSPAAADQQEGAAAHAAPGAVESLQDGASHFNTAFDSAADTADETDETDASDLEADNANSAAASSVAGVAAMPESVVATEFASAAPGRVAKPLLAPVLEAALPPVLAPVIRPVSTTLDAIVTPVVAPVGDSVVTPIVDGVSESVVNPLHEAVTPLVAALVETPPASTVAPGPTVAGVPHEAAEGQNLPTDVDASSPMVHEVDVETRKAPSQAPRRNTATHVDSGHDGAEPSSPSPHPGGGSPANSSSARHSSARSASSAANGEQVERSQRGLLTGRAVAPHAAPATTAQARATVAGASQNSGSRPAFTPD